MQVREGHGKLGYMQYGWETKSIGTPSGTYPSSSHSVLFFYLVVSDWTSLIWHDVWPSHLWPEQYTFANVMRHSGGQQSPLNA